MVRARVTVRVRVRVRARVRVRVRVRAWATCYFFGRDLYQALGAAVPIGLGFG